MTVTTKPALANIGLRSSLGLAIHVAPVLLWAVFVYGRAVSFFQDGNVLSLIAMVQVSVFAVMLALRGRARISDHSFGTICVAIVADFTPFVLLLRQQDRFGGPTPDVIVAISLVVSSWAALSLRRSVSILPGNRGIRTSGAYRFVRHPMYAAQIAYMLGLLLAYPILLNACLVAIWGIAKVLMIRKEEAVLRQDSDYVEYALRVPYRLFPGAI